MEAAAYADEQYLDYEMIGGKVVMMAPPRIAHATVSRNLLVIFGNRLKGKTCEPFSEVSVHFDKRNQFIPDLVVVCNPDKIKPTHIEGAPDLVVEILSPRTAKNDRTKKLAIYEQYGVREYWIVHPEGRFIEVYKLTEGKLLLDEVYHEPNAVDYAEQEWFLDGDSRKGPIPEEIPVGIYEDFSIPLKDVFEGVKER